MSDLKQLVKYSGWFLCLYFSLAVFPTCSAVIVGLLHGAGLAVSLFSAEYIEIIKDGMFIAAGISLIKFKKYAPFLLACSALVVLIKTIFFQLGSFSKSSGDYLLYGDLHIVIFLRALIIPVFLLIFANQIKKICDQ